MCNIVKVIDSKCPAKKPARHRDPAKRGGERLLCKKGFMGWGFNFANTCDFDILKLFYDKRHLLESCCSNHSIWAERTWPEQIGPMTSFVDVWHHTFLLLSSFTTEGPICNPNFNCTEGRYQGYFCHVNPKLNHNK